MLAEKSAMNESVVEKEEKESELEKEEGLRWDSILEEVSG